MPSRRPRSLVALLPVASALLAFGSLRCVGDDPTVAPPGGDPSEASLEDSPVRADGPNVVDEGSTPVEAGLGTLDGALALALGRTHSCAILADQTVSC